MLHYFSSIPNKYKMHYSNWERWKLKRYFIPAIFSVPFDKYQNQHGQVLTSKTDDKECTGIVFSLKLLCAGTALM